MVCTSIKQHSLSNKKNEVFHMTDISGSESNYQHEGTNLKVNPSCHKGQRGLKKSIAELRVFRCVHDGFDHFNWVHTLCQN